MVLTIGHRLLPHTQNTKRVISLKDRFNKDRPPTGKMGYAHIFNIRRLTLFTVHFTEESIATKNGYG